MTGDSQIIQDLSALMQQVGGADIGDWEDPSGGPLRKLFQAVEDGNAQAAADLIPQVSVEHLDAIGPEGDTLLHMACIYGHDACARLLLDNNVSVAVLDEDNSSVLHDAAAGGSLDVVKLILARQPALLRAVDNDGDTALHNAARGEHADVTQYLIEQGADVTAKNKAGDTPQGTCGKDITPDVLAVLQRAEENLPA